MHRTPPPANTKTSDPSWKKISGIAHDVVNTIKARQRQQLTK